MIREPESKSFLDKVGFEKRDPAGRLGFFVHRKKRVGPGIYEILPKHASNFLKVTFSFRFTLLEIMPRRIW
jgi:hypothetical protein